MQHATLTEANLQALASDAGIAAGPASGRAASGAAAPSQRKGEHTRRSDSARAPAPSAKRLRSDSDRSASAPAGKKRARPSPFGLTDAEAAQHRAEDRCLYCKEAGHRWGNACPYLQAGLAGRPSPAGNRPSGPLTVTR